MDRTSNERPGRLRVRAIVGRVIPDQILDKTRRLLNQYTEIRLDVFSIAWDVKYDELFDPAELNFDNGLCGFLEQTEMVELRVQNGTDVYARLKDELRTARYDDVAGQTRASRATLPSLGNNATIDPENPLFDPDDSFLWPDWLLPYLQPINFSKLTINKTPLEQRYMLNPNGVQQQVNIIKGIFRRRSGGIPLNELNKNFDINLKILNHVDVNGLVCEYNELFYIDEPKVDGQDKVVYYGPEKTIDKDVLTGQVYKDKRLIYIVDRVVTHSFKTGIYQATLLLVKRAGKPGLKLGAWHSSMIENFPRTKEPIKGELVNGDAIRLFSMWANRGLIRLKPGPKSRNDLRVFLPNQPLDFEELLSLVHERLKRKRQKHREDNFKRRTFYNFGKSRESSVETLDTGYTSKSSIDTGDSSIPPAF